MTDEMRRKVARLRAIAPQLNAVADEAAKVVQAVEKLLAKELSLGITAESGAFESREERDTDLDRDTLVELCLAYGRIGTADYGIHVLVTTQTRDEWGHFTQPFGREQTRWSGCSQEIKLKSFERLPELLDRIASTAEARIGQATKTAKTVRGLLDAMGNSPSPQDDGGVCFANGAPETINVAGLLWPLKPFYLASDYLSNHHLPAEPDDICRRLVSEGIVGTPPSTMPALGAVQKSNDGGKTMAVVTPQDPAARKRDSPKRG